MANYYSFTAGGTAGQTFTITGQLLDGTLTVATLNGMTVDTSGAVFLKIFATGFPDAPLVPSDLLVGNLYDVEAYSDSNLTIPLAIEDWDGDGVVFEKFNFVVDRRPIYQSGLATQMTPYQDVKDNTATFGVNTQDFRKTGSTGNNTTAATNGRLDWLDQKVSHACNGTYESNFERFHLTNIGGHTSINKGNQQPHFTSGAYQVLNLPQAKYFTSKDGSVSVAASLPTPQQGLNNKYYLTQSDNHMHVCVSIDGVYQWVDMGEAQDTDGNRPYFLMDSPFTSTGVPTGLFGDSVDAWKEALIWFREQAVPNLEITSYQGYRPVFKDSFGYEPIDHQEEQIISLSQQSASTTEPSWQGQNNGDPAYCPYPGWDGDGYEEWVPRISSYFDKEMAGIFSLGFDGIGLDTGTRVWDNSAGRSTGTLSAIYPDGEGNSGIVDYFNGFGLKPVFEAVGLNIWSATGAANPFPADLDARYESSAYWAYFGSWWGWDNGTINYNASGGTIYFNGGNSVVGDPAGDGKAFSLTESEVHAIFQWPASTNQGPATPSTTLVGYILETQGMLELKRCMYDFYKAGLVVSCAGSQLDFIGYESREVFDVQEFYNFALKLAAGAISSRPADPNLIGLCETTLDEWADGQKGWWVQRNLTWTEGPEINSTGASITVTLPSLTRAIIDRTFTGSQTGSVAFSAGTVWPGSPGASSPSEYVTALNQLEKKITMKIYAGNTPQYLGESDMLSSTTSRVNFGILVPEITIDSNTFDDQGVLPWVLNETLRIELWQEG